MKTIQLKSSDNEIFEVRETIAKQSEVILNFLKQTESESNGDEILIPLPNVRGRILRMVIEWIVKHVDEKSTEKALGDWESEFLDLDMDVMYELIMAANYLKVSGLMRRGCRRVADLITGKKTAEIRRMFNIEDDFSPDEEEEFRRQSAGLRNYQAPATKNRFLILLIFSLAFFLLLKVPVCE